MGEAPGGTRYWPDIERKRKIAPLGVFKGASRPRGSPRLTWPDIGWSAFLLITADGCADVMMKWATCTNSIKAHVVVLAKNYCKCVEQLDELLRDVCFCT